jgi:hypothetical protein
MKTFEVEMSRVSYITFTVEAENKDDAEDKAWEEVKQRPDVHEATWNVASVEELK